MSILTPLATCCCRPPTKLREGNVFSRVSLILIPGGRGGSRCDHYPRCIWPHHSLTTPWFQPHTPCPRHKTSLQGTSTLPPLQPGQRTFLYRDRHPPPTPRTRNLTVQGPPGPSPLLASYGQDWIPVHYSENTFAVPNKLGGGGDKLIKRKCSHLWFFVCESTYWNEKDKTLPDKEYQTAVSWVID